MSDKRPRQENFTAEERAFLIDAVKNLPVLESKENSVATTKLKARQWNKLADSFNAQFAKKKSAGQLKVLWKHLKTKTKSCIAYNKRENRKTGGGPSKAKVLSAEEEMIAEIIAADLLPLDNAYDDDAEDIGQDACGTVVVSDADSEVLNTEDDSLVTKVKAEVVTPVLKNQAPPRSRAQSRKGSNLSSDRIMEIETQKLEIMKRSNEIKIQELDLKREKLELMKKNQVVQQDISKNVAIIATFMENYSFQKLMDTE